MKYLLPLLLLFSPVPVAADDLADFQARVNQRLSNHPKAYTTPFSGIFSITSLEAANPTTPVLMDSELSMVANSYGDRWVYMNKQRSPVEPERVRAIRRQAVRELPWHASITYRNGDAPVAMALYSAVDCGYCRRLEAFLADKGFSYTVFPSSLSPENFSLAQGVWCNDNPGLAWLKVMREGADVARQENCPSYPIADIRATGALFVYGNTPGIIFADGTVFMRLPEGPEEEAQFVKEVQAKIDQGIVFEVPSL